MASGQGSTSGDCVLLVSWLLFLIELDGLLIFCWIFCLVVFQNKRNRCCAELEFGFPDLLSFYILAVLVIFSRVCMYMVLCAAGIILLNFVFRLML